MKGEPRKFTLQGVGLKDRAFPKIKTIFPIKALLPVTEKMLPLSSLRDRCGHISCLTGKKVETSQKPREPREPNEDPNN